MKKKSIVKDSDRDFKKFKKVFREISNANVTAGWHEDGKANRKEGKITNAQIAQSLIAGNPFTGQPPRDFFLRIKLTKGRQYKEIIDKTLLTFLKNYNPKFSTRVLLKSWQMGLGKIGEQLKTDIRLELTDNTGFYIQNSPNTIKKWQAKFKSRTGKMKKLFTDTGQLINAITMKINKK